MPAEGLGDWMREKRERAGRGQRVIAQLAGMRQPDLSDLELGRRPAPVEGLRPLVWLADALRVPRADFVLRALAEYERTENERGDHELQNGAGGDVTVKAVTFVPDSLSAAQRDMLQRMPPRGSSVLEWAEFHRYNADMFRLARNQFSGHPSEDDWTGWNIDLQSKAARKYMDKARREEVPE
jgi:transcriptional regulator with XRE-family HTH domain